MAKDDPIKTVHQDDDGTVTMGFPDDSLETKQLVEALGFLCTKISLKDLERLVNVYNQLETTMPIFDPTSFMRLGDNLKDHKGLAVATLRYRRALGDLVHEAEKREEGG